MKKSLALLVAAVACAPAVPTVDTEAVRQELLQADVAFYDAVVEFGSDGWADFFAEDGVMFSPGGRVDGRENIRNALTGVFTPGVASLTWEPTDAFVDASGSLGYTLGTYREMDGDSVLSTGHYTTIWKRENGSWKVAVDIGSELLPTASTAQ